VSVDGDADRVIYFYQSQGKFIVPVPDISGPKLLAIFEKFKICGFAVEEFFLFGFESSIAWFRVCAIDMGTLNRQLNAKLLPVT
jgi:hypothetical protein